jgi:hypothetical protein
MNIVKFLVITLLFASLIQPPIVNCMDTSGFDSTDSSLTGTSSGTYNDDGGVDKPN